MTELSSEVTRAQAEWLGAWLNEWGRGGGLKPRGGGAPSSRSGTSGEGGRW